MLLFTRTIVSRGMPLAMLLASLPQPVSAALDIPSGVSRDPDSPVMRLGPVEVHPYLFLRETYSDNVYLTHDHKKYDFITSINPGLSLQLPYRRHTLTVGGDTTINRYVLNTSEDTTDWSLYAAGDVYLGSRINLKLSDIYRDSHESRSQSSTAEMEKYRSNIAALSLIYGLVGISRVQLDYSRTYLKYRNNDYRSRDEDLISAYLYYRVLPRTSVFVEYEFKNVSFMENSSLDNSVHSALLGVTWELSERSRGTVKGGYLLKNFDQQAYSSVDDFTASVDVSHYFSDYNFMKLSGARTVSESSVEGTRYSVNTGIRGDFTHRFLDRLSVTVRGSYREDRFSDTAPGESRKRRDRVVQAGASLQYLFRRWLECDLEYSWWDRHSNNVTYDNTENNVSLTFKASF